MARVRVDGVASECVVVMLPLRSWVWPVSEGQWVWPVSEVDGCGQ